MRHKLGMSLLISSLLCVCSLYDTLTCKSQRIICLQKALRLGWLTATDGSTLTSLTSCEILAPCRILMSCSYNESQSSCYEMANPPHLIILKTCSALMERTPP